MKADRAERCLPRYGFRDYRPEAVSPGPVSPRRQGIPATHCRKNPARSP
ncbi:hypothetical protein RADP37_05549 [Roseomonas mucosa]|uniref:Uncharacterized protein n=1 Tax=Roseomonas mucosa TaxID=207340 RepID=A0A4Y1N4E6_9PROT|nr:hypothetical protein RADP37_05549 [Roseomonas mucosa]